MLFAFFSQHSCEHNKKCDSSVCLFSRRSCKFIKKCDARVRFLFTKLSSVVEKERRERKNCRNIRFSHNFCHWLSPRIHFLIFNVCYFEAIWGHASAHSLTIGCTFAISGTQICSFCVWLSKPKCLFFHLILKYWFFYKIFPFCFETWKIKNICKWEAATCVTQNDWPKRHNG